jgi:hypothetical protein
MLKLFYSIHYTYEKNHLPALGFRHHKEREESPEETHASGSSWKAIYSTAVFRIRDVLTKRRILLFS